MKKIVLAVSLFLVIGLVFSSSRHSIHASSFGCSSLQGLANVYLTNGSFSNDSNLDGVPDGWTKVNPGSYDKRVTLSDGSKVYQMSQTTSSTSPRGLKQSAMISRLTGNKLIFSLRIKSETNNYAGSLRVKVQYYKNSSLVQTVYVYFAPATTSWGWRTCSFATPNDFSTVTLTLESGVTSNASGTSVANVWWDEVRLYK